MILPYISGKGYSFQDRQQFLLILTSLKFLRWQLRTRYASVEEKGLYRKKKKDLTALDLKKCLKPRSIHPCAPIAELPYENKYGVVLIGGSGSG